jgi:hypothetical protein
MIGRIEQQKMPYSSFLKVSCNVHVIVLPGTHPQTGQAVNFPDCIATSSSSFGSQLQLRQKIL